MSREFVKLRFLPFHFASVQPDHCLHCMAVTDGLDRVAWLASVAGLAEEAQLGWVSGTVGCLGCRGKFGLPFFEQASLPSFFFNFIFFFDLSKIYVLFFYFQKCHPAAGSSGGRLLPPDEPAVGSFRAGPWWAEPYRRLKRR